MLLHVVTREKPRASARETGLCRRVKGLTETASCQDAGSRCPGLVQAKWGSAPTSRSLDPLSRNPRTRVRCEGANTRLKIHESCAPTPAGDDPPDVSSGASEDGAVDGVVSAGVSIESLMLQVG